MKLLLSKTAIWNTYGVLESHIKEEKIRGSLCRYRGRLDISVAWNMVSVEADFVWEKQGKQILVMPDTRARIILYRSLLWEQEITDGRLMVISQQENVVHIIWSTINILQNEH